MTREANTSTLSIQLVRVIVGYATSLNADPVALLDAVGLDMAALEDADRRVPATVMLELWALAPRVTNQPDFGLLLGEATGAAGAPLLAKLFLAHPTLGDGLARIMEFMRLSNDVNSLTLEMADDVGRLSIVDLHPSLPLPRQAAEYGLSSILAVARTGAGRMDIAPVEVCFQHPEPPVAAEHRRVFAAPVRFGQPRTEIAFARAVLQRPNVGRDPMLVDLLAEQAKDKLGRLPAATSFAVRVKDALAALLPSGRCDLEAVAERLHLSTRSVQRYLKDEKSSFQETLDATRETLALTYLRERSHSIAEIALLLGFSDQAAFHKAFVRRTGKTPGDLRRVG